MNISTLRGLTSKEWRSNLGLEKVHKKIKMQSNCECTINYAARIFLFPIKIRPKIHMHTFINTFSWLDCTMSIKSQDILSIHWWSHHVLFTVFCVRYRLHVRNFLTLAIFYRNKLRPSAVESSQLTERHIKNWPNSCRLSVPKETGLIGTLLMLLTYFVLF